MGAYQDNLRHLAEPAAPSEREKAVKATLRDYEALWFTEHLREFAHYGDGDDGDIAVAYASYIDSKVREEGRQFVDLYVHTERAANTLMDALYHHCPEIGNRGEYPMVVFVSLEESLAEVAAHYLDDD